MLLAASLTCACTLLHDGKVVAVLWGTAVAAMLDGNGARITSGTLNNFAVRIDQAEDIHENEMLPLEQWTEQ